ncbi:hypothetical protein F5Y17DRAFT_436130 [Xylariaceae sp. FL0594]|nr:hypothetical protein F5Y17DRAFT_436130 [Xylariaceae sp. FL0594]
MAPGLINPKGDCFRFLDLAAELRLQIYDLLLVSRLRLRDRKESVLPPLAVGNTNLKLDCVDYLPFVQPREFRTLEPVILQTCKQIYQQAIHILYSQNVFRINEPALMFRFMAQIGPSNTGLIRSLDIYIVDHSRKCDWLNLIRVLGETTGLKSVVVSSSLGILSIDPDVVRALEDLSKVGVGVSFNLGGFYANPWRAYFRDLFETSGATLAGE